MDFQPEWRMQMRMLMEMEMVMVMVMAMVKICKLLPAKLSWKRTAEKRTLTQAKENPRNAMKFD